MADFRGIDVRRPRPDGGSTSLNALAFSTLLSSQETDAHHRETLISHPGLISFIFPRHRCGDLFKLPGKFLPVKSGVPIKSVPIQPLSTYPSRERTGLFGAVQHAHATPARLSSGGSPGPGPPSGVPSPRGKLNLSSSSRVFAQPPSASGAAEPTATPLSQPQSRLSCSLTFDDTTYRVGSDGSFENLKEATAGGGCTDLPCTYCVPAVSLS